MLTADLDYLALIIFLNWDYENKLNECTKKHVLLFSD